MSEAETTAPPPPGENAKDGPAIRAVGLVKHFGAVHAVDGVDLTVPRGAVFGLIGPNGAGKTTTFGLVCGWVRPSAGVVEVLGTSPRQVSVLKGRLAALPQDATLPATTPVLSSLAYLARLQGFSGKAAKDEAARVLALVGLSKWGKVKAQGLSHGMAKRVGLAQAFIGHPEVVLLDEPTAGLDPKSAHSVRKLILEMKEERTTVVVSSHNLYELEAVCDHAAILDRGRVIASGPMDELTAADTEFVVELADPPERYEAFSRAVSDLEAVTAASVDPGRREMVVRFKGAEGRAPDVITAVLKVLIDGGAHVAGVHRGHGLERRVLSLT